MQILAALHRFAESGTGDVKALQGRDELRLRVGDYRVFFVCPEPDAIEIRRAATAAKPIAKGADPTFGFVFTSPKRHSGCPIRNADVPKAEPPVVEPPVPAVRWSCAC
jgi:hypothetical protein